ncbi:MAG: DUF4012 domain-containing protein [Acidimicrobiia bacterium]
MSEAVVVAVTTANRWLAVFSIVAGVVVLGGMLFRRFAQGDSRSSRQRRADRLGTERRATRGFRGFRRRGGLLLALGPLVGLVLAPSPDSLTIVLAVGAGALAVVGALIERRTHADRIAWLATLAGAFVAVVAGARFGPTGVEVLDIALAFAFVVVVTQAVDGLGNVDGMVSGLGAASAVGIFAIAAFGHQDDLATVALGLTSACFAFLAFNFPPASLFVGRAGRLAVGYALAVGALAVDPVPGPARSLVTPPMLLAVVLLDVTVVAWDRLRRRRRLLERRSDHMVHRLAVLGWKRAETVGLLVAVQVVASGIALFTARAVLPVLIGAGAVLVAMLLLRFEVLRGHVDRGHPVGLPRRVWLVAAAAVVVVGIAVVPTALAANDSAALMLDGRDAASRGLAAARDGDTVTAGAAFDEAARTFSEARDKLDSPLLSGSMAVPGVASNLRAVRTLASIGADLADAGKSVSAAVDPDALQVIDGRLPVEEVVKVTPALEKGSTVLTSALRKLDDVRDDPYLAAPVKEAIDKIHAQLAQAEREARHAAAAARLAPAIFGADGTRHYLLVVQNNAESRATGGFIGSFATITAENGKLTVSEIERTGLWNDTLRARDAIAWNATREYRTRYAQFKPETNLQNVNLTPDFPAVATVLMSLAPQAGVGPVDGVIAVDPAGLAALLSLTGPVTVPQWPSSISSDNVVDVTLRDAYAVLGTEAQTEERVDFLGDVAHAAVDAATTGDLGKPASIAKALGAASHEGHLVLAFARADEQRLAEQLDAAGHVQAVRSDSLAVTTSNFAANKIDYYLDRAIDYRVKLQPETTGARARATAELEVQLDNTAPATGLPQIVIGPFDQRFTAGVNRSFVSLYSPLRFGATGWGGASAAVSPGTELGRNVVALVRDLPAETTDTLTSTLDGTVDLHDGWYTLDVVHQPTLNADHVRVSVGVPAGWKIDAATGMKRPLPRRAVGRFDLTRNTRLRVHITRDPGSWDLWGRLEAGT